MSDRSRFALDAFIMSAIGKAGNRSSDGPEIAALGVWKQFYFGLNGLDDADR